MTVHIHLIPGKGYRSPASWGGRGLAQGPGTGGGVLHMWEGRHSLGLGNMWDGAGGHIPYANLMVLARNHFHMIYFDYNSLVHHWQRIFFWALQRLAVHLMGLCAACEVGQKPRNPETLQTLQIFTPSSKILATCHVSPASRSTHANPPQPSIL